MSVVPLGGGPPRRRPSSAGWLVAGVAALAVLTAVAARLGLVEAVRQAVWVRPPALSAADFPLGVSSPDDGVVSIPMRATRVGLVPRGCTAPLLWAARPAGLFSTAYALEVEAARFMREDDLVRALVLGSDNGGVDLAALPVSTLAMAWSTLSAAAPRTVLLLGRSRGSELMGALPGLSSPAGLQGKRLGVEEASAAEYFALWVLARFGLALEDVKVVPLHTGFEAGQALVSGEVDAAVGAAGEVGLAVESVGGTVLATTADAPHLVATVLVVRGDFATRYPDAIRRLVRGVLDANQQLARDAQLAQTAVAEVAPELKAPLEALAASPPANLQENLAFFGVSGPAAVTYAELLKSAGALASKLKRLLPERPVPPPEDTVDLGALKYVSAAPAP